MSTVAERVPGAGPGPSADTTGITFVIGLVALLLFSELYARR